MTSYPYRTHPSPFAEDRDMPAAQNMSLPHRSVATGHQVTVDWLDDDCILTPGVSQPYYDKTSRDDYMPTVVVGIINPQMPTPVEIPSLQYGPGEDHVHAHSYRQPTASGSLFQQDPYNISLNGQLGHSHAPRTSITTSAPRVAPYPQQIPVPADRRRASHHGRDICRYPQHEPSAGRTTGNLSFDVNGQYHMEIHDKYSHSNRLSNVRCGSSPVRSGNAVEALYPIFRNQPAQERTGYSGDGYTVRKSSLEGPSTPSYGAGLHRSEGEGQLKRSRTKITDTDSLPILQNKAGEYLCPHPTCGQGLNRAADARRHFRKHEGDEWQCPRCDTRCGRHDLALRHFKLKHDRNGPSAGEEIKAIVRVQEGWQSAGNYPAMEVPY
ncbi:hypothetical protein EVG20_g2207 [Dentipellis fragilis]|uniref:C2H2-type domain-containing protein n=1 Tax=Dentipellis fragilis TaxID=205917 RepID=A0A4Y9Z9U9_9AGAM|nr:hypothetical protein EVG20_g2207 [Dentipellis fragilis]